MGSKNDNRDENRRDVTLFYRGGRTETFTGVREQIANELENLPFREGSGVNGSCSTGSASNRKD